MKTGEMIARILSRFSDCFPTATRSQLTEFERALRLEFGEELQAETETDDLGDDDGETPCTNPSGGGHQFTCTGTAYGGDDERYHGEGRSFCIHCGADGDA